MNIEKFKALILKRKELEQQIDDINSQIDELGKIFEKLGDGVYRISYDKQTEIELRLFIYPKIEVLIIDYSK